MDALELLAPKLISPSKTGIVDLFKLISRDFDRVDALEMIKDKYEIILTSILDMFGNDSYRLSALKHIAPKMGILSTKETSGILSLFKNSSYKSDASKILGVKEETPIPSTRGTVHKKGLLSNSTIGNNCSIKIGNVGNGFINTTNPDYLKQLKELEESGSITYTNTLLDGVTIGDGCVININTDEQ